MKKPKFPTKDGCMWQPQGLFWAQMCAVYGVLLVVDECQKANLWLLKNPGKWKTCKGMPRFLNLWMGRAKPESNGATNGTHQPQRRKTRNDQILELALASLDSETTQDDGGRDPDAFTVQ
jgi:hypothetical protein